jgi:hypothetical protein
MKVLSVNRSPLRARCRIDVPQASARPSASAPVDGPGGRASGWAWRATSRPTCERARRPGRRRSTPTRSEHYAFWQTVRAQAKRGAVGRGRLPPGLVGENLTLRWASRKTQLWIGDPAHRPGLGCQLCAGGERAALRPCYMFDAAMGFASRRATLMMAVGLVRQPTWRVARARHGDRQATPSSSCPARVRSICASSSASVRQGPRAASVLGSLSLYSSPQATGRGKPVFGHCDGRQVTTHTSPSTRSEAA